MKWNGTDETDQPSGRDERWSVHGQRQRTEQRRPRCLHGVGGQVFHVAGEARAETLARTSLMTSVGVVEREAFKHSDWLTERDQSDVCMHGRRSIDVTSSDRRRAPAAAADAAAVASRAVSSQY